MHTHGTFCWYECATPSAVEAKAFYGKLFGWSAEDHPLPGGMPGVYTRLKVGDAVVAGLYELRADQCQGAPPHWATYLWVDDVDEVASRAGDLGGERLTDPFDVPGVGRIAVIRDGQGAVLMLLNGGEHGGVEVTDGSPGSFCWSELATTDVQAAREFYCGLIGWDASDVPMANGGSYVMFKREEAMVGGVIAMEGDQWQGVPPHWMNYVAVEDVDLTASLAKEIRGAIVVPPTDIPDVGRFAVIQDPTGAVLSILTMKQD